MSPETRVDMGGGDTHSAKTDRVWLGRTRVTLGYLRSLWSAFCLNLEKGALVVGTFRLRNLGRGELGFLEMGIQIFLPNKKILGAYVREEGFGFPRGTSFQSAGRHLAGPLDSHGHVSTLQATVPATGGPTVAWPDLCQPAL